MTQVDNQAVNSTGVTRLLKDEKLAFTVYGKFIRNSRVYATFSPSTLASEAIKGMYLEPENVTDSSGRVCSILVCVTNARTH